MTETDIRALPENEVVLHFGGRLNEVDAFTFSNSLVAFAEALQEINRQIFPNTSVEILVEGLAPGSFRTKINAKRKALRGLWTDLGRPVLIGVLATLISQRLNGTSSTIIKIDKNEVVIQTAEDRIIVPRHIYDARQKLSQPQQVERHIARAFAAMEDDPSVTDFGLTGGIDDKDMTFPVQREKFAMLSMPEQPPSEDGRRYRDERTNLIIIKAVFQRGNRKWEFVWHGGVRISATIQDSNFFDKLASREFWFAQGDEMDVMLRIHQRYDDVNGVFINEWYEVVKVFQISHRDYQPHLPVS